MPAQPDTEDFSDVQSIHTASGGHLVSSGYRIFFLGRGGGEATAEAVWSFTIITALSLLLPFYGIIAVGSHC